MKFPLIVMFVYATAMVVHASLPRHGSLLAQPFLGVPINDLLCVQPNSLPGAGCPTQGRFSAYNFGDPGKDPFLCMFVSQRICLSASRLFCPPHNFRQPAIVRQPAGVIMLVSRTHPERRTWSARGEMHLSASVCLKHQLFPCAFILPACAYATLDTPRKSVADLFFTPLIMLTMLCDGNIRMPTHGPCHTDMLSRHAFPTKRSDRTNNINSC